MTILDSGLLFWATLEVNKNSQAVLLKLVKKPTRNQDCRHLTKSHYTKTTQSTKITHYSSTVNRCLWLFH